MNLRKINKDSSDYPDWLIEYTNEHSYIFDLDKQPMPNIIAVSTSNNEVTVAHFNLIMLDDIAYPIWIVMNDQPSLIHTNPWRNEHYRIYRESFATIIHSFLMHCITDDGLKIFISSKETLKTLNYLTTRFSK